MNPKDSNTIAEAAVAAVICAAGSSKRMAGGKKEYRPLHGSDLTVLGAAVSAFAAVSEISVIVITVPAGAETEARNALPREILSGEKGSLIHFVPGGETRRGSVFNALHSLSAFNPDYVLIHDGARPWISPGLITRIITAVKNWATII